MEKRLMKEGLSENKIDLDKATVSYWVGGIGPTLLLIHGYAGLPITQWASQVDALIGKYRLIIPNLLWFGKSHSEESDFSIDHQVEVLVELLKFLAADKVNVIGLDYGGYVAYELAADYADIVNSVILVNSPGRGYTSYDYEALCRRQNVQSLGDLLVPASSFGVEKLMGLTYYEPPKLPGSAIESILKEYKERYRDEKVGLLGWLTTHLEELDQRSPETNVPVLIIWGEKDTLFPPELGKRLALRLGDTAALRLIGEAKRCPNQERKDEFNSIILDFLAANEN